MTTDPRGTCPVCGRDIALRKDGTVRAHGTKTATWSPRNCLGSGEHPKETLR